MGKREILVMKWLQEYALRPEKIPAGSGWNGWMIDDCKTGARGALFCQKMGVAAGHFFELQREHAGLDERICRCGVGAALEIFRRDRGDLADEVPEKIFEVFEIVEIKTLHDHLADERRALDQIREHRRDDEAVSLAEMHRRDIG